MVSQRKKTGFGKNAPGSPSKRNFSSYVELVTSAGGRASGAAMLRTQGGVTSVVVWLASAGTPTQTTKC